MVNAWVIHVRAYAKKHNITYMCAISKASKTYKKTKKTKKTEKTEKEKSAVILQKHFRGMKGREKARRKRRSNIIEDRKKLFKDLIELDGKILTLEGKKKGGKMIKKGGKDRGVAPDYKYWNERTRKSNQRNPFTKEDNEKLKKLKKTFNKEKKKDKYRKYYNSLKTEREKILGIPTFMSSVYI